MSCPPKHCTHCMRIPEAAAIKGAVAEPLEQERNGLPNEEPPGGTGRRHRFKNADSLGYEESRK